MYMDLQSFILHWMVTIAVYEYNQLFMYVLLSEWKVAFARISRNVILYISDVQYEVFYILPIMIIAHRICYDVIIIAICFSSPVWMIVEIQMTKNI